MSNLLAAASDIVDKAGIDLNTELEYTKIEIDKIMKLVERHRISGGREEHQATKEMLEDAIARAVSGNVKDDLFDRSDK